MHVLRSLLSLDTLPCAWSQVLFYLWRDQYQLFVTYHTMLIMESEGSSGELPPEKADRILVRDNAGDISAGWAVSQSPITTRYAYLAHLHMTAGCASMRQGIGEEERCEVQQCAFLAVLWIEACLRL